MIFAPEDLPGWTRGPLRPREQRWLDEKRAEAEADTGPNRSAAIKLRRACDRLSLEAGWVAEGLRGWTVTVSTSSVPEQRRGTGPSDPTLAAVSSTWREVEWAVWRWAHLAGPCEDPDHDCPESLADIVDLIDLELDWQEATDVIGVPITDRHGTEVAKSFADTVQDAGNWWSKAAATLAAVWTEHDRDRRHDQGLYPRDVLEQVADRTAELASRMASLAGSLASWSDRLERRCAAGCGGSAPPKGEGATCVRCRQKTSRQQRAV